MAILKLYSTDTIALNLPVNYASRTVFRFYTANNDGNNQPLTGFISAVFSIYITGEPTVDIPMVIHANGDVVMSLASQWWTFGSNVFNCAIFLDNDYVPFVSGQVSFGTVILPDQSYAIMNASRNAVLVNNVQYENPAFANSLTAQFSVTTINGVNTITITSLVMGTAFPQPWVAQVYTALSQVVYSQILWIALGDTLATDVPGVSALWVKSGPALPSGGTTGQVLTKQSATNFDAAWDSPAALSKAVLRFTTPLGQAAGDFTQNTPTIVVYNENPINDGVILNLSGGNFTLAAGTYDFNGPTAAHGVGDHKTYLYNVTTGSANLDGAGTYIDGMNTDCGTTGASVQTQSLLIGRVTFTTQTIVRVYHICNNTKTVDGQGKDYNAGHVNIHAIMTINKVA